MFTGVLPQTIFKNIRFFLIQPKPPSWRLKRTVKTRKIILSDGCTSSATGVICHRNMSLQYISVRALCRATKWTGILNRSWLDNCLLLLFLLLLSFFFSVTHEEQSIKGFKVASYLHSIFYHSNGTIFMNFVWARKNLASAKSILKSNKRRNYYCYIIPFVYTD